MPKLDKYILTQLFGPFVFFCLVFAGILWLNQALAIIDVVIENGQPANIFLKLSALLIPQVLESAIPIAAFAASIFVTNRLYGEAELVVMMAAGVSNIKLARPFIVFGIICMALMFVLIQFLSPWAKTIQLDKRDEIKREFITQVIQPGEFIINQPGFTFFFGEKSPNGAVRDVLIEERIDQNTTITHIAKDGQVVSDDDGVTLLLTDGSIQRLDTKTKNINLIQFDSLAFDLTQMGSTLPLRKITNGELNFPALSTELSNTDKSEPAYVPLNTLFHERLLIALLVFLSPVLGMASLLVGGFNRSGFLMRIAMGILFMAAINSFRGVAETWAVASPKSWPYIYSPVVLTVVIILILIWLSHFDYKAKIANLFAKTEMA